jgi:hypothetical protein
MKIHVQHMHTILLGMCVFHDNQQTEGLTFLVAINEVTYTPVL